MTRSLSKRSIGVSTFIHFKRNHQLGTTKKNVGSLGIPIRMNHTALSQVDVLHPLWASDAQSSNLALLLMECSKVRNLLQIPRIGAREDDSGTRGPQHHLMA